MMYGIESTTSAYLNCFSEEVLVPTRNETHYVCYRVQYDQIKTTSPEVIISSKYN